MRVVVEADGGARGNPGVAGYGAVVRDAGTGAVISERSAAIGVATNNVAEYSGLIAGLQAALDAGATQVDVRMDSKLVVEQMSGRWQIKNPGLRPLAAQAAALVRQLDQVTYQWIPRERNKHADALANQAMDNFAAAAGSTGTAAVNGGESDRAPATREQRVWEPPTGEATRMLLVRHGATEMTEQQRYSGRGDVPLSASGNAQAEAVAQRVRGLGAQVIVSSPLIRCTATAAAIGAADVPVEIEQDLVECHFGEWEGKTFAEVRSKYRTELAAWLGSTSVAPPGGESFQQVARRVRGALAGLRQAYPGRVVAVVSHVSPIKLILRDALAASDALLHRLYLDAGGLSIVDYYADGGIAVRSVNDTAHLSR